MEFHIREVYSNFRKTNAFMIKEGLNLPELLRVSQDKTEIVI